MHLNYIKSWMLSFLVSWKNQFPEFKFRVITSKGPTILEELSDIESFAKHLAVLGYASPLHAFHDDEDMAGERYIFSTPFDTGLGALMELYPQIKFHIVRTATEAHSVTPIRLPFFESFDGELIPGLWIFRREKSYTSPSVLPAVGHRSLLEAPLQISRLSSSGWSMAGWANAGGKR